MCDVFRKTGSRLGRVVVGVFNVVATSVYHANVGRARGTKKKLFGSATLTTTKYFTLTTTKYFTSSIVVMFLWWGTTD